MIWIPSQPIASFPFFILCPVIRSPLVSQSRSGYASSVYASRRFPCTIFITFILVFYLFSCVMLVVDVVIVN